MDSKSIAIYFKYGYLDSRQLCAIPGALDRLYNVILETTAPVYVFEQRPFRNFLEISQVQTGESIRFGFKEGWRPEFSSKDGDVDVLIPKFIGVPALVLLGIFGGVKAAVGLSNDILDHELKRLEVETKTLELRKKMDEERSSLQDASAHANAVTHVTKTLIFNKNISHLEINNIEIPCGLEYDSQTMLLEFLYLKTLGVHDPDLDLFIAVWTNNVEMLASAMDSGANANISLGEVVHRHMAKLATYSRPS